MSDPAGHDTYMPLPVMLLSFGYYQDIDVYNMIWQTEGTSSWYEVNLLPYLPKDPSSGSVSHEETGTSQRTQVAVMSQSMYLATLQFMLEQIISFGISALANGCAKGNHRAWTISEHCCSLLNGVLDKFGRRVYNAQHIHLSDALNRQELP